MATASDIAASSVNNASNIIYNTVTGAITSAENAFTTSFVNAAPTNISPVGAVFELKSPQLPNGGFFYTAGSQTTPGLSRGSLANASLATNNADLSHVCDFKFTFSLGLDLGGLINPIAALQNAVKNGKMAAANAIRAAISQLQQGFRLIVTGILSALNLDPTGVASLSFSTAKYYVRLVTEAINRAAQIVYDVSLIVNLAKDLQQIITWIETLPAQLKAIVAHCLTNFKNSLNSTVNNIQSQTNIHNITSGAINQLTNSTASYGSTLNSAVVNAVTNPTAASAGALTNHITETVASATPSYGTTAKTASQP